MKARMVCDLPMPESPVTKTPKLGFAALFHQTSAPAGSCPIKTRTFWGGSLGAGSVGGGEGRFLDLVACWVLGCFSGGCGPALPGGFGGGGGVVAAGGALLARSSGKSLWTSL